MTLINHEAFNWRWPNFTPWELRSDRDDATRDDFKCWLVPEFLDRLQALRTALGFPLTITSYYRSPAYNAAHSGTGETGPHTTGMAVDIQCSGGRAFKINEAAARFEFTGIGWQQKGPHAKRFIHLDTLDNSDRHPRPWIWSY